MSERVSKYCMYVCVYHMYVCMYVCMYDSDCMYMHLGFHRAHFKEPLKSTLHMAGCEHGNVTL